MAAKVIGLLVNSATKRSEGIANAGITPGHLVERMTTGNIRVHATAGGNGQHLIANKDMLQGREIGTAYTAAERMFYFEALPGDEYNMILANGQLSTIGAILESAGDGTLQAHVPDTMTESIGADSSGNVNTITVLSAQVLFKALAALDLSDSSGADPASARIRVVVI